MITKYRAEGRFEPNWENQAIVDAKYKAMEVIELLLNLEFNNRLEVWIWSTVRVLYALYCILCHAKHGFYRYQVVKISEPRVFFVRYA